MRMRFTKMQGVGNDFVVLDGMQAPVSLSRAQLQRLGDRRLGVGADQILVVEPGRTAGVDFSYRIYNGASGAEVEHCGNGARCFMRYVHERGYTTQTRVRVATVNRVLELQLCDDGQVRVDMSPPVFEHAAIPFDASGLQALPEGDFERWPVAGAMLAVLSMGNPHAVIRVENIDTAAVATLGALIEHHARFAQQVNVGFMQVLARGAVRLRVHERQAGETLACGTGACAAVVAGVRLGWLDGSVQVQTLGGLLRVEYRHQANSANPVFMTGPAETVFEGEIEL